jgi:hypothetical protein
MPDPERPAFETLPIVPTTRSNAPTWRYLGERHAADLAYCARFGVTEAPEPTVAHGGGWAYALPATRAPS